ncbi:alpha-N-acetylgalactosaminide alpha-2,6-sialyltransferase 2 [Polypterus senegalus]|uniref:alpha-N-acetylgalactosaminide alpha-2,6-sialyltransferase 2 n=1 Tax=Polypterus senegalus TaxID=55291 RepID=UPI001962CC56|nr:alpha-N-acetylgalactosaminide alpha-2,6-sialyltransferase 2 [Polypterus senegalus]XP_039595540.1 alpha-N-acetylgalactosaminide alpha-2,6-sialyltransferase 2 [Polypterus senegalus]
MNGVSWRLCKGKASCFAVVVLVTISSFLYGHYRLSGLVGAGEKPRISTLLRSDLKDRGSEELSRSPWNQANGERLSKEEKDDVVEEEDVLVDRVDLRMQKKERKCPSSLRKKIESHERLKALFSFEIPVLMWNGHLNDSEWQRLQHSPPPYGWQGLPYKVVSSTLSLLNDSAYGTLFPDKPESHCIRCAVIGNGGILNGSRQGRAIDDHDFVFRLNGAVMSGFEEDVGTKTSFYGFTTNTMKNSLIAYRQMGFRRVPQGKNVRYIFIPSEIRDYVMLYSAIQGIPVPFGQDNGDKPWVYFGFNRKPKMFRMLHPDFIHYIKERFLNSSLLKMEYKDLYMPSTGALLLLTALHTCDEVSAYGFITDNFRKFSDHYYDRVKRPLVFYANHDMQLESRFWKLLNSLGVMRLYQRP